MYHKSNGGSIAQWSAYLLPDPAAPGSIPSVADAEVNQRRWLEESGQWLENVDQTHQVLPSGKLALQKGNVIVRGLDTR